MPDIVLINPTVPMQHKKDRVPNIGLLATATVLNRHFEVQIVDHYSTPFIDLASQIPQDVRAIAFSCSSAESYYSALQEALKIKFLWPHVPILMGGQHITGLYQSSILPKEMSCVDCYFVGSSEITAEDVFTKILKGEKPNKVVIGEGVSTIFALDYKLYPNWEYLIPCVEIGRGCNHSCNFCNSRKMRELSNYICRDAHDVLREIEYITSIYGKESDIFLFGSIFGENTDQTNEVLHLIEEYAPEAKYTFNLRVDCQWEKFIDALEHLKIRSVFFGMENAADEILLNMKKTTDPQKYRERALTIFKKFTQLGIPYFTSFILGYWGENKKTLIQNRTFLEQHCEYLSAIGVNRYYIYPGSWDFDNIISLCRKYNNTVKFIPQLQTYILENKVFFSGNEIELYCNELEVMCNHEKHMEDVRRWRFN
jgi:radical SAM superfamily enzyme YgiQ (UPF0313 family)